MLTLPGLCLSKAHLQFGDLVKVILFGGEVEAGHSRLPLKIVASAWFEGDDNLLSAVGRIGIAALREVWRDMARTAKTWKT